MGADGAQGLAALRRAGGFTMVQDEASSVVFGMPRAALAAGAATIALPPGELGKVLARIWSGGAP
jgi:two-component system chemotaxis response regulator CheB